MGIFSKIIESKELTAFVFVILLLVTEVLRYKKRMYYNKDTTNPKMNSLILNVNYNLNKKKNIDIDKINKYIFISSISAIIAGGFIMAFTNISTGLLIYIIAAASFSYIVTRKI